MISARLTVQLDRALGIHMQAQPDLHGTRRPYDEARAAVAAYVSAQRE
jgi:hypothetical protein